MTAQPRIEGTPAQLMAEARQAVGVDIVDDAAVEPLSILVDSYNASTRFTPGGAVQKRAWVLRILKNRLRMLRDFAAHPEIHEIELLPPLLINTMPRTGSTKLQKMLAATGDFNWLPYWMCMNSASETGVPNEDVSGRIADIAAYAEWFDQASPDTRFGHHMEPLEAEEEAYVMMQSLVSHTLAGFATATDYSAWAAEQDLGHQYRYLTDTLRYLIWQGLADRDKPFMLKCVANLGFESQIRDAIPGVQIAMTHRDPVASIASAARLGQVFRKAYSDHPHDVSGAPVRWSGVMGRHLDHRVAHPDEQFLDLDYVRVREDATGVIGEVFEFAGVEPSESTFTNVAQWEAANPQRKLGGWSYRAEDFGFTDDDTRTAFGRYIDWVRAEGIADWPA